MVMPGNWAVLSIGRLLRDSALRSRVVCPRPDKPRLGWHFVLDLRSETIRPYTVANMMIKRTSVLATATLVAALLCVSANAITLTLRNDWIEQYRRRVTIDGIFTVEHAHASPNRIGAGSLDGDLHIAGLSDAVGLPMVAEIMNAARFPDAVKLIHDKETAHQSGGDGTVPIRGVWRLWFEHPGHVNQVQFGVNNVGGPPTNPDHVFEIHPVTKVGQLDLLGSLVPIRNDEGDQFEYKDATRAFADFRRKAFSIKPDPTTTTLTSTQIGYNYVRFLAAKLESAVYEVPDGAFVFATVFDLDGLQLVRKVRLALVAGSEPYQRLKAAPVGARVEVIGLPRVSLSLVSWRMKHPEARDWSLPYEMVAVAIEDN